MANKKRKTPDEIIAKAMEIYKREGGKEVTSLFWDHEVAHKYCLKARKELGVTDDK